MSKVQVDTIDTRSGTSTMQIGSTNTSTINIGVLGDTVNIPSGVTIANAGTATGFGGANTPAASGAGLNGTNNTGGGGSGGGKDVPGGGDGTGGTGGSGIVLIRYKFQN